VTATRHSHWTLSCDYPGCPRQYMGSLDEPSLDVVRRNAGEQGWSWFRKGVALNERCPQHPRAADARRAEAP
jgi:hypothetical protein